MASQPDPSPDRIDPQSPSEVPPDQPLIEEPTVMPPDIVPPQPDVDYPDSAPPEIAPD